MRPFPMVEESTTVLSDRDFHRISGLIHQHCGINLHDGKKELVRARLAKRVRHGCFRSFREYVEYALNDLSGNEFGELVDCLTTNTTSFFREERHFDYLRSTLLPALIAGKGRTGQKRIRAWSAACSSGEEPYSLAITLLEAINDRPGWDVRILATDISSRMLETCQAGLYTKERVRPMLPQQRQKYMGIARIGGETYHEVGAELRSVVRFRHLNLMEPWPFSGPFDFIFCRNVMIYFDKPTQGELIERFRNVLPPGGYLFLGHSESLTGVKHRFSYVQPTIYQKA